MALKTIRTDIVSVKSLIFMRLPIPFLFTVVFLLSAQGLAAQTDKSNWVGLNLTFALQPLGPEDPYSGPLGLGIYYERHGIFRNLYLGGQFSCYGFYPLRSDFGSSFMLTAGAKAGYEFLFPIERRFAFSLSPYLAGLCYWRRFDYQDKTFSALRPLLTVGAEMDLLIRRHSHLGVNLELMIILDETRRLTMSEGQRIGVRF